MPHGVANSIILPHAMRFNADTTASQLAPAAEAMGIAPNGRRPEAVVEAAAQKVYELVGQMNLPRLAQLAFQSRTVQNNPKPIADPAQIEALLRAAW